MTASGGGIVVAGRAREIGEPRSQLSPIRGLQFSRAGAPQCALLSRRPVHSQMMPWDVLAGGAPVSLARNRFFPVQWRDLRMTASYR
jgi:hypothetical protein